MATADSLQSPLPVLSSSAGDVKLLILERPLWWPCKSKVSRFCSSPACLLLSSCHVLPAMQENGDICIKPAALAHLNDAVFRTFVTDLQTSVRGQPNMVYPIVISVFALLSLPTETLWLYAVASLILFLLLVVSCNLREDVHEQIRTKVDERQFIFREFNLEVDYVVSDDEPLSLCTEHETYVHFQTLYPTEVINAPPPPYRMQMPTMLEEAKYHIAGFRVGRRNDQSSRCLDGRLYWRNTVKPPALRSFDTNLFHLFISELDATVRKSRQWGKAFFSALLFIFWAQCYNLTEERPLARTGLALLVSCTQFVTVVFPGLQSTIFLKVEQWRPRLEEHGFTVCYEKAKAGGCSCDSGRYVHIRRTS